jgi:hypothetical protein
VPAELETLRLYYDREGDFLEVTFADADGYFRETDNDHVMARVDASGAVIGFSIVEFSAMPDGAVRVDLTNPRPT